MFAFIVALCAFSPQPIGRRETLGRAFQLGAATTIGLPFAAFAVPQPSPQAILKSRAVYGSRIYRLQDANPSTILDEKNAFTLFLTGVYGASADKPIRTQLEKLEKAALAAAKKGDAAAAQAAIQEFVARGQITEVDKVPGSYYNAKSPCDRAGLQCGFKADEIRQEMAEKDQRPLGEFGSKL
jgi:hypothetical protein